jgi:hypothetical protein
VKHPPGRPRDEVEPERALRELTTVERWAERFGAGGRPAAEPPEDSMDGPEFSVETTTRNGMHRVVGIAGTPGRGDPCRAVAALSETERSILRSVVRALLDLAGHECGPARTEVVLTAHGPRIVGYRLNGAGQAVQEWRCRW